MVPPTTIFWVDVTEDDAGVLERVARAERARVVAVQLDALATATFAALAQGAVVFVARTAQEASRALGMGVDEVIRAGEITEDNLAATLARARARAAARSSYELRRGLFQDDDESALGALVSAFGNQLSQPVASASLECEMLASALSTFLEVSDQFVEWTARGGPPEPARQLAARRLALPSSHELQQLLSDVRASLRRTAGLASTLSGLTARANSDGAVPIVQLVTDVVDVMRADFAPWASFDVRAEGPCAVSVPPVTVAFVLSALLVNAVDAVRAARREGGRVDVRLSEHEEAVVLEVQDNGRSTATDLRPSLFEPYFNVERANRTGIVRVRDRMRRCGGDVTVDSDGGGTTVRVLLPTTYDDVLFEGHSPASHPAKIDPPESH